MLPSRAQLEEAEALYTRLLRRLAALPWEVPVPEEEQRIARIAGKAMIRRDRRRGAVERWALAQGERVE